MMLAGKVDIEAVSGFAPAVLSATREFMDSLK
jgi:hypothetical protein